MASQQQETRDVIIRLQGGQALRSIKELEGASRSLRKEWKNASDENSRNKIAAELKNINTELQKQQALTRAAGSGWDKVSGTIMKMGGLIAGMMGFQMITDQFGKMISKAAELSDSMADVQKTTGLTKGEVQGLADNLKKIDTRTGRKELLGLAYEAGKLGKTGVADVQRFVEEADKITVALGEDLGEGAVLKIGKMAGAFKTGMLNIASAVNTVGQSSMASEAYLVDFTSRLQGVGVTAGISAADIIGYGATLDSLGIQAETSSTALSTFFIDFIKNTEGFGQMAGFAAGELSALVGAEGTNAGFVAFLTKLKEANPEADDFARKLEQMGIDGARGAQTFLALSNNLGMVKDMQMTANDAFTKGSSIMDEFNIKNENFAANLEKLTKNMGQMLLGSSFTGFIERGVNLLNEKLTPATESYQQQLIRVQKELNTELTILQRANFSQEERATFINKINTEYAEYLPNLIDEHASLTDIEEIQKKVNKQMASRILYIRYEEEIKKILDEQVQSLEGIAKAEEARTRAQVDPGNLDGNAAALDAQSKGIEAIASMNQFMVDDTDKKVMEVETRYARMAEMLGSSMAEIERMLGTDAPAADGGAAGGSGGTGSGASGELDKEQAKRIQQQIDNTKRLQEQLQQIRIASIDNVEQREIAAAQDAYVREVQKVTDTEANEAVKADLIAALAEQTQNKVAEIEKEAAQKRVEEFERQVQADIDKANNSNLLTLELKVAVAAEGSVDSMQANIDLLAYQMEMELQNLELTEEQKLLIKEDYALRAEALYDEFAARDLEKKRTAQEQQMQDAEDALTVMQAGWDAIFSSVSRGYDLQIKNAQTAHSKELDALQKQLDDGLISKEYFEQRSFEIDKQYAAQERQLKREQWEVDQMARIAEGVMGVASAVIVAMSGGPIIGQVLAGITAALGAVQVGMIASETNPYYKGGRTKVTDTEGRTHNAQNVGTFSNGGRYSSPSFGVIGERGEELVIPNNILNAPQYADMIGQLEYAIARGYAVGGRTSTSMSGSAPRTGSSSSTAAPSFGGGSGDVVAALNRNTEVMERLMAGGITAKGVWEWDEFRDGVLTQETIENTRYFRGSDTRRPGQQL